MRAFFVTCVIIKDRSQVIDEDSFKSYMFYTFAHVLSLLVDYTSNLS